jgi:hypothetical protein
MPTITDEQVMKQIDFIAVKAGKAISQLVSETMSDDNGGSIKWTPDRFIALEMGYTVSLIQRLTECTTEVVTKATAEIMLNGNKKLPPDVERLLRDVLRDN